MANEFAEVVLFKLTDGTGAQSYIEASESSRQWYRRQPGFRGSELIQGPGGRWLGIIHWENQRAAEEAAGRIMGEVDMSPLMPMIDMSGTEMLSGEVMARDE